MLKIIFLCVVLCAILFTCYYIFKKEVISPTFICTGIYIFSLFVLLFYCNEWEMDLSFKTCGAIVLALLSMALGEYMGTQVAVTKKSTGIIHNMMKPSKEESRGYIAVSQRAVIICLIFSVLTAILYFRDLRVMVANSEYAQSSYGQVYSFLMQARKAKTLEGAQVSYYVQHMFSCSGAIAMVFAYIMIFNAVNGVKRSKNFLPMMATVIVYIITSFMTTGRAQMLNFFIYIVFAWIIVFAKKRNWVFKNNIKLLLRAGVIVAFAILLFYLAGFLTEKSLHYDNFFDNFAMYFSSSIYALNEYLKNPANFQSGESFFGIHTLSGIYSFLRTLGFNIPDSTVALEYIDCGGTLTNIYTPLRRYIQDFGWVGMSLIMFFVGYFYKRLIWLNKSPKRGGLCVVLTAHFMFPLVYMAIEERIFMDVILMRSIYEIFYIVLIYQWIVKRKFFNVKLAVK